jgi:hypothetical protein
MLTATPGGSAAAVLPALDLLPHVVRTAARDIRTLMSGPSPNVVMIDARTDLADARATCRMLHATGSGIWMLAVVTDSGLIALAADWGIDDRACDGRPGRDRGPVGSRSVFAPRYRPTQPPSGVAS